MDIIFFAAPFTVMNVTNKQGVIEGDVPDRVGLKVAMQEMENINYFFCRRCHQMDICTTPSYIRTKIFIRIPWVRRT